jgi:hypothetical protein
VVHVSLCMLRMFQRGKNRSVMDVFSSHGSRWVSGKRARRRTTAAEVLIYQEEEEESKVPSVAGVRLEKGALAETSGGGVRSDSIWIFQHKSSVSKDG